MKKSELKSLIREVISEINISQNVNEDGVGNDWKRATIQNSMGDEGYAWRVFATKLSNGDKDLENAFHMAISAAEDNGNLQDNAVGSYSSKKVRVDVDLHKGTYKITKVSSQHPMKPNKQP